MMAGRSQMHKVFPGIALGIIYRYQEMRKCLYSDCESMVLKAEKVLSVLAYVLGFATPGQVIWKLLKILIKKASTQIAVFLEDHPSVETSLQISLFTAEQYGLAHVWDLVRDGSICMRFYNCDNEFLAQLSNIKITVCNVHNPRDERRTLSVCERMFNDSPLMLLGVAMLILTAFATTKFPTEDLQPAKIEEQPSNPDDAPSKPDDPPAKPDKPPTKPDDPPTKPDNPPTKPDDPPPKPDKPPTKPDDPPTKSDGPPKKPDEPPISKPDTPKSPKDPKPPVSNPKGSTSTPKNSGKTLGPLKKKTPTEQDVHARCPKCSKDFYFKVPRPWTLGCASVHTADCEHTRKTKSSKDETVEKVIREVFKDIKCDYCKSKIKKRLIELQQKKNKKQ